MDSLPERIEIINSFTLLSSNRNQPIEKRIRNNSIFLYLYITLIAVMLIIVLSIVCIEVSGIKTRYNWSRASLLVLFSINFLNMAGSGFYRKLILNHLKFLETSAPITFDDGLNHKLEQMLVNMNKPLKNNIVVVCLMVIVLIGTTTNILMDKQFPYYNLFIVPTLLFYVLASFNILSTYKRIKANIEEVENSTPQHQLI